MPIKGKRSGRLFMFVAAALLCVGAGVGVGRLSGSILVAKAVPATHTAQNGQKVAVQGVKIHGWWTIKVLDGSRVVAERQFENALVGNGASDLALILTGQLVAGHWNVFVYGPSSAFLFDLVQLRPDLTVTGSGGHVILSGNHTASSAMTIAQVQTALFSCGSTQTGSACAAGTVGSVGHLFTDATLATPVSAASGQIVQITVDISFS